MDQFDALVVDKTEELFSVEVKKLTLNDLPEGDVLIRVLYSSLNYKDGLACNPDGGIVRSYPFVPGIDLAGNVVSSTNPKIEEGDRVLVTGYELGVSHYGGFSEYARVSSDWIVQLPEKMSFEEAMTYGTAGFTAALSVQSLEENGVHPDQGPVLVTGSTGGVGSLAVSMLAKRGYHVVASTGKESEHEYLKSLGAKEIISREDASPEKIKSLDKQRWAGVVDPVGGRTLAYCLSTTKYGGSVAVSGLTAGAQLKTTVLPFILRSVNLIGIDSVYCSMEKRKKVWERLSDDLKQDNLLDLIYEEVSLNDLQSKTKEILEGNIRGRVVVKL